MRRIVERFNGDLVTIEKLEPDTFMFSEFASDFHFHIDDNIEEVKRFALDFLNSNYPEKAPFTLTRIETKQPRPGITGTNRYCADYEVFICFSPLLNRDFD